MAEPRLVDLAELKPRLQRTFDHSASKFGTLIDHHPDYFPIYTKGGRWRHEGELWTDWCAGFLTGVLWHCYRRIRHDWWLDKAEHYCRQLEHKKHDRAVHDLGFIFLNSYLPWYELTGDESKKEVVVTAGKTLAERFRPKGQYLCSFIGPESLFIDIMMNVPIIFYAARESGDESLLEVARAHCRTTERTIVRADGGTAHEGIFDTNTGEFLRQSTHQGLSAESDWTRGLAWSLYGFGTVYSFTNDPADLAVAERNADHFIERCPEGLVAPWDFDAPDGDRIDDSSASAIAASGLWQLSDLTKDPSKAARYQDAALTILDSLCTERYVSWADPEWEGVLKRGVYHKPKGLGVGESVMWGEFFFMEAISKALTLIDGE
jgi:unsaturated chondroitin disaccharide hydrolase